MENFGAKSKQLSSEVLEKWRKPCGVVKNPKRRFGFIANLSKGYEAEAMLKSNQGILRIAVLVAKAAIQFFRGNFLLNLDKLKISFSILFFLASAHGVFAAASPGDYTVPEEVKVAGFQVSAEEFGNPTDDGLAIEGSDFREKTSEELLEFIPKIQVMAVIGEGSNDAPALHEADIGLQMSVAVNKVAVKSHVKSGITDGLNTHPNLFSCRQQIYGINRFAKSKAQSFSEFVWKALQDKTLMILWVQDSVSLIDGLTLEGRLQGAYDGLRILAIILLAVFVTTSDYCQSSIHFAKMMVLYYKSFFFSFLVLSQFQNVFAVSACTPPYVTPPPFVTNFNPPPSPPFIPVHIPNVYPPPSPPYIPVYVPNVYPPPLPPNIPIYTGEHSVSWADPKVLLPILLGILSLFFSGVSYYCYCRCNVGNIKEVTTNDGTS